MQDTTLAVIRDIVSTKAAQTAHRLATSTNMTPEEYDRQQARLDLLNGINGLLADYEKTEQR